MEWLAAFVLITISSNGGGVTTTSGISQFWADDYKVFDQVYGKTSDKDIYGETLPATVRFDGTFIKTEPTDKKEKYLLSDDPDAYGSGSRGNIVKQSITWGKFRKPPKSNSFISYENPKHISLKTDPETYNYLKHLENYEKDKRKDLKQLSKSVSNHIGPEIGPEIGDNLKHLDRNQKKEVTKVTVPKSVGFSQYMNYVEKNPEETDGFKSIQAILEEHEANQSPVDEERDSNKNLYYHDQSTQVNGPPRVYNEVTAKCQLGRCRKRAANAYRVKPRPYLRRVKYRVN